MKKSLAVILVLAAAAALIFVGCFAAQNTGNDENVTIVGTWISDKSFYTEQFGYVYNVYDFYENNTGKFSFKLAQTGNIHAITPTYWGFVEDEGGYKNKYIVAWAIDKTRVHPMTLSKNGKTLIDDYNDKYHRIQN